MLCSEEEKVIFFTKNEEYTGNDPGLKGIKAIRLGRVGGDGIEDVHQNQEQGDQKCHATLKFQSYTYALNIILTHLYVI